MAKGDTLRIVLVTVGVPLLILGLGLWEIRRGETNRWELEVSNGAHRKLTRQISQRAVLVAPPFNSAAT